MGRRPCLRPLRLQAEFNACNDISYFMTSSSRMYSTLVRLPLTLNILLITALGVSGQNYTAVPRWGQASAIIYNTLFVSGGKTDPEHQFTYNSAPNTNDLLSLDLSTSFALSSPPWSYISGSQDTSSSQGPAVAFHTLNPYTSTDLLLFGGDAGFNMIETNADSAWLLNVKSRFSPSWASETAGWASEPIRRIYHAATSASGAIYILGGQKADGSQIGFPDPYLFNAVADNGAPAFIPLSNDPNAPTGLFGHAAHVLPDGAMLTFGGFFSSAATPNTPSPFSTIYVFNTTSSTPWSIQNATGTIPLPRRGFASALLKDGKILIHGGADAVLQTLYSDGAILDTTQIPMSWSPVGTLSDSLGPRVGHFAAPVNGQVLFGFGWAGNAPASANLALYDPTLSIFQPTFTPSPGPVSITTLPVSPTTPGGTYPTSGANIGTTQDLTQTGEGATPTSQPGNSGGQGGHSNGSKASMTGAVIGSVFGFLAFVALGGGVVYYSLRQRERRAWRGIDVNIRKDVEGQWRLMPGEDPWDAAIDESHTHPGNNVQMAGSGWQPRRGWGGLSGLGSFLFIGGKEGNGRRRRDMLADEDAHEFDVDAAFQDERVTQNSRPYSRRQGTGGSSMSSGAHRINQGQSTWNNLWNASVTSLRNVGVSLGVTTTGATAALEGVGQNVNSSQWWEKEELPLDPFTDEAAAEEGRLLGSELDTKAPMRPRGGEYAVASKDSNPYVDPFQDVAEGDHSAMELPDDHRDPLADLHDEGTTSTLGDVGTASSRSSLPLSFAMVGIARSVSPGSSERGGTKSADSHEASSSRTGRSLNTGAGLTSSSTDHSSSISTPTSPRTTSIIGAITAPTAPMRRSDSWWSRFSRTSFLDRHNDYSHHRQSGESGLAEFRDPNPPPRLGPIQESAHPSPQTTQDNSPSSATVSGGDTTTQPRKAGSGYAASTKSSIKTANSELIERMDGRMQVVQRALSLNSRRTASPTTTLESPAEDSRKWGLSTNRNGSDDTHRRSWTDNSADTESYIAESPTASEGPTDASLGRDDEDSDAGPSSLRSQTSNDAPKLAGPRPPRRTLTGAVAARVSAYEQRMSQDVLPHNGPRSPPEDIKFRRKTRDEERHRGGLGYGFVPKAPLFVANPDRRNSSGAS
ncbi:hypothetical protein K439DRAFT_355480 [Ramaria rubella]|nr:hypothetical protein K439DRAFT_355480 [Ramaria rubella]